MPAVVKARTIRFATLVEKFGRPEQFDLWRPPAENPEFARALKDHRVITVIQRNIGTKKDVGVPGFLERPGAAYLVFPKSIPYETDVKIVGINYDLLAGAREKKEGRKPRESR